MSNVTFSKNIEEHVKHLMESYEIIKKNGLVVFASKMKLLGMEIYQGKITPTSRVIEFAKKIPNENKDKKQLQRFLGCLNYIYNFILDIRIRIVLYLKG